MWVSFGEPHEVFSRINESYAGKRRRQSVARFNSDNLFCREASMAEPNESEAPDKEEFLISNCTKCVSSASCQY